MITVHGGNDYFPDLYNNKFWKELRETAANNYIPLHGHFEITPQCNLDCKMCYVHLNKTQMGGTEELELSRWKIIIDQAVEAGMIFASISGGECLTSKYFDDLYLYLKKKGVIVFVLTNGVLLEDKLELFVKYPPALIQVSMYGYDEESYYRVTGKKEFDRVSEAILKVHNSGLGVCVAVTASRLLPSVYEIVKKYYDLNIGVTVNKWLMPPYEETGRMLENFNLTPEEQVKISLEIIQATNQVTQKIKKHNNQDMAEPNNAKSGNGEKRGLLCAAGRSDFSINWKGEMSLCVSLNGVTGYPLKDGFEQAWRNTVDASKNFLMAIECYDCAYLSVCNRCPAQHLIKGKPGHCNKDVCKEGMLMVKHGISIL